MSRIGNTCTPVGSDRMQNMSKGESECEAEKCKNKNNLIDNMRMRCANNGLKKDHQVRVDDTGR